jgi:hypothetical protein
MRINRRRFLLDRGAAALVGALSTQILFQTKDALARPAAADKRARTRDEWMAQWMRGPRSPAGTLQVSRFRDPMYFLLQPIAWKPNPDQVGTYPAVDVPTGFVTDFASIPRVFWSALRPDGEYAYPAVIHDYLYWRQQVSRDVADDIFKLAMEDFEINRPTILTIYSAVRTFGQSAWDDNAIAKAHGEKRVLLKYPTDPRVRWKDWKVKPDVFAAE